MSPRVEIEQSSGNKGDPEPTYPWRVYTAPDWVKLALLDGGAVASVRLILTDGSYTEWRFHGRRR
jgi:hypothetical protein